MVITRHIPIAAVLVCVLSAGLALGAEPVVQWEELSASLRAYFEYPTPENAKAAYKHLPVAGRVRTTGRQIEIKTVELWHSNIRLLERQAISGDAEAVRLAFRLFSIANAAYTEDLEILLGKLIRINPRLFLKELAGNKERAGRFSLGGLLGNKGEEYVDLIMAQCLENRLRRAALQSVSDYPLRQIRDECTRELDRQWHAYCGTNSRLQSDGLQPLASDRR
ncbi:MAG: hypothetical protein ACLQVJ_03955 [Syntrophobacteraceae bacterium]